MTENSGRCWVQPSYYPFLHASNFARGTIFRSVVSGDTYRDGTVPYVESVTVYNEEKQEITVLAVNRSEHEETELELKLAGFESKPIAHIVMDSDDLDAINTADEPERVKPHDNTLPTVNGSSVHATLPKASWNVLRFKV